MANFGLDFIFALLLTLTGNTPLEISAGSCPDGTIVATGLFAVEQNENVVVTWLPALAVLQLSGFPLERIGPIAAVLTLQVLGLFAIIFGAGSMQMAGISTAAPAPALGAWGLIAAVALLLFLYARKKSVLRAPGPV